MQRIIQTVSAEAAAHLQIRRSIVAALGVSLLTNAALALTLLTKTDNSRTAGGYPNIYRHERCRES